MKISELYFVVIIVSVLSIGVILGGGLTLAITNAKTPTGEIIAVSPLAQSKTDQQQIDFIKLVGDSPYIGSKDSRISIIVFADPSCPFCGAVAGKNQDAINYLKQRDPAWEPAIPNIIKDYVNSGKAVLVEKYFPGHGKGEEAMKIMLCANEQDKFWNIHDVVYANQNLMENGDIEALKKLVVDAVNLDKVKLDACLLSNKYNDRLNKETEDGISIGVSGTPTFVINGRLVKGAQSYGVLKPLIEYFLI